MRICYLADGRYIHTLRWLRYFGERGNDVSLVSFAPMGPEHLQALEEAGGRYLGEIGKFHLKRFWLTMGEVLSLRRLLRREKIDVLHCHFLSSNAWFAALSGFHPLVITVMGGGDVCGPDWQPNGVRERLLTPFTLRRTDLVTSWSRVMADVVRPYCREDTPVEVIHGGINLERFNRGPKPEYLRERWNLPPEAKVVFSPRLMRPLSNITTIAAAAGLVREKLPHTYFLFSAPAEERIETYEAEVRRVLREAGAEDNVRFVGAIPHDEMADYHRFADVTISIPGTDGTPMTVLESMACGTPVIVGDIPDYDQYYFDKGKTVLMATPTDAGSVAEALVSLLMDSSLAQRLSTEAEQRVRASGSYESQMSKMNQLYTNLLRGSQNGGRKA
ncbi:MAG TPA: glycosyltransferase family 4 protein [Pyrinomonadaceae bacterium]|nr:glycosyltransferase family 4 protein [Pyrinomonadaceae bacterium]